MKRVLIVEDSLYMRSLLRIELRKAGYEIVGEAGDGITAIELVHKLNPDIVTLDNILPDMLGIEVLEYIHSHGLNAVVIMVTAMNHDLLHERAGALNAEGFLSKPFKPGAVKEVLDDAIKKHHLYHKF
ncbi:response regulator [Reichenbachiella ulvae]|uniref:Response regulator n=1 Tax=Reichenbachiella ulvae TaxID=2980104 RepID=A0ABT3CNH8_9BACT|nr:response regulator [Reichenbachiella ulvae]MCV9385197.1 response regulator [Reichenbachiella ulvae]